MPMVTFRDLCLPLLVVSGAAAVDAQSLGELALKEKERRAKIEQAKPSGSAPKVITQEDLDSYAAQRPAASESTGGGAAAAAMGGASGEAAESAAERGPSRSSESADDSDERARLEKSWRARAEQARGAVTSAERELEAAQYDRNGLGTGPQAGGVWRDGAGRVRRMGGEDPGQWTQRANAADARLARARSRLDQAKQGLEQFEEEARRAGIPPGWVR